MQTFARRRSTAGRLARRLSLAILCPDRIAGDVVWFSRGEKHWHVALGYVAVLVVAATLLYGRRLQEHKYPNEASGGMWAAGDGFLQIFSACLFMVPTVFLVWVTARFEAFYTASVLSKLGFERRR